MSKDLKSLIVLFKAHQSLQNSVKHSLVNTQINVNEFAAMEALYTKGVLTTQQLIDTILIPNSSMTYVLEILNKKGYIERSKKLDDKRVQIIRLSKLGTKVFETIYERHYNYMRTIFDVLSDSEEKTLQKLLKKVGKQAEENLIWNTL